MLQLGLKDQTYEECQNLIDHKQILAASTIRNPHAMEQYKERELKIAELQTKLQKMREKQKQDLINFPKLSKEWRTAIMRMVSSINEEFSKFMEDMGFSGRVLCHIEEYTKRERINIISL